MELCVEEGLPVAVCVRVVAGDTVCSAVLAMVTEGVVERVCVDVGDWDGDCVRPCVDVTLGLSV